jgi:hypothetical protein
MEVQVTHPQALAHPLAGRLARHRGEQRLGVQRRRATGVAQVGRPQLARPVGGKLDAVAVGIGR